MATLTYFAGTMDSGKSTLALQMNHNHSERGRRGVIFTRSDRAGEGVVSSRLGLRHDAVEVTDATDFWDEVIGRRTRGVVVDYLVCDEAQFYSELQIEQLARVVDELEVDVFAFGITTDFRTRLFPGSARLVELADRVEVLQVQALCWCGRRATQNARTIDGVMVTQGEQVLVGDTAELETGVVGYEVLCRRHHMRRMTATSARAVSPSPDPLPLDRLPLDLDVCSVPPRRPG
ncbi:thymidine kinase [Pseudactinotalea suaedae]|jgi:thymidine kinase|uniref:thymidine kinase n=1 Tax=Pseudactinotalea suaedae TaxID=1524924 RepID=UPI0012E0D0B4|nr:thymidine kinase [Pseudactinotalea suaedae]